MQKHRENVAEAGSAPKVRKGGQVTNPRTDHLDEMATKFVFLNLASSNKEDVSEDGRQVKRRQVKYLFSTPRGLKTTASGGTGDTELQGRHHRQGQDFGKKNIKAAKEGDKEKTEQADGDDRLV